MRFTRELEEKDSLIEKLYKDIKVIHEALSSVTQERNQTVELFEENKLHWTRSSDKLKAEKEQLLKVNRNLKADSEEMLIQLDKFSKLIKKHQKETE